MRCADVSPCSMPICDGYEASSLIRKSEPNYVFPAGAPRPPSHLLNRGIPIIAVTANSQERLRDQLITSGIGTLESSFLGAEES